CVRRISRSTEFQGFFKSCKSCYSSATSCFSLQVSRDLCKAKCIVAIVATRVVSLLLSIVNCFLFLTFHILLLLGPFPPRGGSYSRGDNSRDEGAGGTGRGFDRGMLRFSTLAHFLC